MDEIRTLSLDLETYSSEDLAKSGVYRYAESRDFEILLFGYSANEGPVRVVDIARGEEIPDDVLAALADGTVEKWAYNAQFERVCLSEWLHRHPPGYPAGPGPPGFLRAVISAPLPGNAPAYGELTWGFPSPSKASARCWSWTNRKWRKGPTSSGISAGRAGRP